jgi:non-ribosomal peptide synthase protein (TIGR01720 family)
LLVIHHLVVDGISWRVLIEDLESAYHQLASSQHIRLMPKTTSYLASAERLKEYAGSEALVSELPYWLGLTEELPPLPRDYHGGRNTQASAKSVSAYLTVDETNALLHDVPRAYNTQANDVLLTALHQAFAVWTESASLLIDLEGHGRPEFLDDLDLSRTVGCYTALFPVLLRLEDKADPGQAVKAIKEQLRQIPNRGIGYGLLRYLSGREDVVKQFESLPAAEVSFNYLGQFGQLMHGSPLFGVTHESAGPLCSPQAVRAYVIDVVGRVIEGRLRLDWVFSENLHQRATIEDLADRFMKTLRTLICHCQSPEAEGCTPSDYSLSRLNQTQLDAFVGRIKHYGVATFRETVEDVYVLSPAQQGMLFHSLYAPESGVYCLQTVLTVRGRLDLDAFVRAWDSVIERHAALRTAFAWEKLDHAVQIAYRRAVMPVDYHDWSGLAEDEPEIRLEEYLETDRRLGFNLEVAPLMRLAVFRLGPDSHQLVWTNHHLILDAWSGGLVFREVFEAYDAFFTRVPRQWSAVRPYRDYIAWLERQNALQAEPFWRRLLAGFRTPLALPFDRGAGRRRDSITDFQQEHLTISGRVMGALNKLAKDHRLTLNTFLQGAWALLLSEYTSETDIVFGTVVLGRPAGLNGIESMVGLFINTLPFRARIRFDETPLRWLQNVQQQLVQIQEYDYSSLVDIQQWSDLPRGAPLFETIFGFESIPGDAALFDDTAGLPVVDTRLVDWNNYPLSVAVTLGTELTIGIKYDRRRFQVMSIRRMLESYERILSAIAGDPESRIGDLVKTVSKEQDSKEERILQTLSLEKLKSVRRRTSRTTRSIPRE